jgi:hypothetical protein
MLYRFKIPPDITLLQHCASSSAAQSVMRYA